jgi:hypothetical protein
MTDYATAFRTKDYYQEQLFRDHPEIVSLAPRMKLDEHGLPTGDAIGRAGLFCSRDQGLHWVSARLEPLNPKGQTYCRDIREVPGDPKTIWVAGGANFQSDVGVLFRSKDGGSSWMRMDMGVKPKTTMFAIAFDERQPKRMYCATSGGEVFASEDGGVSWACLADSPHSNGRPNRSRCATSRSGLRSFLPFPTARAG